MRFVDAVSPGKTPHSKNAAAPHRLPTGRAVDGEEDEGGDKGALDGALLVVGREGVGV